MSKSPLARKTDPFTSHQAAQNLIGSGAHGNQRLIALALVKRYPGRTYRDLFAKHLAQCRGARVEPIFQDAPSLMRRLGEVARKDGTEICPATGRPASKWYPL